jgi:hypothetical protein
MVTTGYRHKQKGPVYLALLTIAAVAGLCALLFFDEGVVFAGLLAGAMIFTVLGVSFREMTVEDQGQSLLIRFGPLPLFQKRLSYAAMTGVEAARCSLIDGLGIHCVPGRGWIYNLWGGECVLVRCGDRRIRIGSDDVAGLLVFLQAKISERP